MSQIISIDSDYAARINEEHSRAYGKARDALTHARMAGELLIEAKSLLKHGEWGNWLTENVSFSESTAQNYMRLAKNWDRLVKSPTVGDLGLRKALSLLSDFPKVGDFVEAWVPPLSSDRDYMTCPWGDSRTLVISPSRKHENFYEFAYFDTLKSSEVMFTTVTAAGVEMFLNHYLKTIKEDGSLLTWKVLPGESFSSNEENETACCTVPEVRQFNDAFWRQ
jgi:hypothetical protein